MSLFVKMFQYGLIKVGEFTLSSGIKSPFYIDMRQIYSYPQLALELVEILVKKIDLDQVDILAGVATAGIPLAAYISCLTGKPMVYIRKERKDHGLGKWIEGGEVTGKKVAIVDDVATTGSSLAKAVAAVRESGGLPTVALVIVNREQGADKLLESMGVKLVYVISAKELFNELYREGAITPEQYHKIVRYLEAFQT